MVKRVSLLTLFVGLLITCWGYRLRYYQFGFFPEVGDTYDEFKYAFSGISLIKNGVPESWSYYKEYGNFPIVKIAGVDYRLVRPYFDDPPLFGLMSGIYVLSRGINTYDQVRADIMRRPMINLGALNVFLLFILVWFLSGRLVAIFSALIFAIEPTFVISSRLPLAENMITTFMLVSLILVFGYFRWPNRFLLAVLLLVSGGAILLKSTAIFVPVSLIFIFLARKRYREMFYVVGSTLFFVLIWFGYGYYYNWGLFIKLLGLFSGRELWRPDVIASLFDLFRIGEKPMQNDHWILWGWVCAILFGLRKKKDDSWLYFVTTMGGFLIFFSIMSGHYKGWYRFPLYPLLSWAMAEVWVRFFKKPNFFFTFFFTSLPVSYAYIWGRGMVNWSITEIRIYQKIFPILMGIPLLADLTKSRIFLLLTRILLLVLFALMIYWGSITILNHSDSFWYK